MKRNRPLGYLAVALATCMIVHGRSNAAELGSEATPSRANQPTSRFIVKWNAAGAQQKSGFDTGAGARKASALTGMSMVHLQTVAADLEVLESTQALSGEALDAVVQRLEADPAIDYASPDFRRRPHAVTSDPLLSQQWYLLSAQPAATRTELAWDVTQGTATTIVAVLDTGVRFEHPDLGGGKLLPGYDFVNNTASANDGDGRDGNASDPGDWVTAEDKAQAVFSDCDTGGSSWHGTRVSGLIGALTSNGMGVAGAAWNTSILPVRVLGKCGGFDSDIIAGMRWAAGLTVTGAPVNATPAKIINLSLGGEGLCSAAYQSAVNEITARGVLIVASAGNEGGPVDAPANCTGVLGVAGLRHAGTKVGFSSLGPEIGIGAPGGNCVNTGVGQPCVFSIIVPFDTGTTTPVASSYTDAFNFNVGTSFSAPLAAAAAALMTSVNSALTPAQTITVMKSAAAPFTTNSAVAACRVPTSSADLQDGECNCTTTTCGAGMLDTGAAVAAAMRPFTVLNVTGTVASGGSVAASAVGSFASNGRTITRYDWTVLNVTGTAPVVLSPAQSETVVQTPGTTQFTLRLTVTDDIGGQSTKDVALGTPAPAPAPTTPPATTPIGNSGGGGGGGGEFGWELLLGGALLMRRRGRHLR